MADIIIEKIYRQNVFTWDAGNLVESGAARVKYLHAIREADEGRFEKLLKFYRS